MPNLRVIYNNVADRATGTTGTIAASTSANATTLPVSNLQNDFKGRVHRSTGTTVTYSLTWTSNQTIGGVILPCTNLSSTATILVQAYTDTAFTAQNQLNTGATAINACPNTSLQQWALSGYSGQQLNVNLFPYGGLSKTSWWFTQQYTTVRGLRITLTDTNNPAGYIDCSRIVCGQYWSPTYNADKSGLVVGVVDSSEVSRTDNGDLLAEQGFVYDQLSFNLGVVNDADRNTLVDIMRTYGVSKNIAVSVFPDGTNTRQEQIYTIYGKRENSDISYILPGFSSHQVKIIGW